MFLRPPLPFCAWSKSWFNWKAWPLRIVSTSTSSAVRWTCLSCTWWSLSEFLGLWPFCSHGISQTLHGNRVARNSQCCISGPLSHGLHFPNTVQRISRGDSRALNHVCGSCLSTEPCVTHRPHALALLGLLTSVELCVKPDGEPANKVFPGPNFKDSHVNSRICIFFL